MEIEITNDPIYIEDIVEIHLKTFTGFFLTFLGKGFLTQLYKAFMNHAESNIIIAKEQQEVIGFIAYSENISSLYKYMIRHSLIQFAWYAFIAFMKKPNILMKVLSAFSKADEVKRSEKYIELASIGVSPISKSKGVGSKMIQFLIKQVDFKKFFYISLETDANNNEYANGFYKKNGFILDHYFETPEGRKMNEYHFYGKRIGEENDEISFY